MERDGTFPLRAFAYCCKGVESLGKEGSARGEEPLFKAVFVPRIFYRKKKFRALHGQRLAAGPRQGHSALDPRKMRCIFP